MPQESRRVYKARRLNNPNFADLLSSGLRHRAVRAAVAMYNPRRLLLLLRSEAIPTSAS
jgi:hypothetical protein